MTGKASKHPTTSMLNEAVRHVSKYLDEQTTKKLHIRTSKIGGNGRCLFDFHLSNVGSVQVMIGVVYVKDEPAGYYVVPHQICPKVLLVRPGSKKSKWFNYYCPAAHEMANRVQELLKFKPNKKLIAMLS